MNKQKLLSLTLPAALSIIIGLFLFQVLPTKVWAQNQFDHGTGGEPISSTNNTCPDGYIKLSIPIEGNKDCIPKGGTDANSNPIFTYLRQFIRFLTAGVGLVVVMMIIIGGIQYTTSSGNPQAVETAKKKIFHAITALLLFIFMAAILNYLIPGGLV